MTIDNQKDNFDYDVIIAGGGMVGISLALQLAVFASTIKILIVESFPVNQRLHSKNIESEYHPKFDARSTAVSRGSQKILADLGIWELLKKHISPISAIHVSDRRKIGSTLMHQSEVDWPALGYVIENTWLGNVLLSAVNQFENIDFSCPSTVSAIKPLVAGVEVSVQENKAEAKQKKHYRSQLVVIADGANSDLRKNVGIDVNEHDYQQTAIITNVCFNLCSKKGASPVNDVAFERFTDWGPMALLPLESEDEVIARSSLVWTMSPNKAEELLNAKEDVFLNSLQERFGHRVGEFTKVGERFSFPLKLVEACEQVRSGVVVMGNAAHSLHPVAGQGFNLALRDCARLSKLLVAALNNNDPLGGISLLLKYQGQQSFDQKKTINFSDKTADLFTHGQWPLSILRGMGLGVVDISPALKKYFIEHAAGMNAGAAGVINNAENGNESAGVTQ